MIDYTYFYIKDGVRIEVLVDVDKYVEAVEKDYQLGEI